MNYWEKLQPDVTYHIYNRAVGGGNLFFREENYSFFLNKWKSYLPYFDVYAYCLLPNHFHFLARVKDWGEEDLQLHLNCQQTVKSSAFLEGKINYSEYLEDQFKRLFSSYALAVNKQEDRHGTLFQKRFKRVPIDSEYRLCSLLAYIHHNPIHHQLVTNYSDWKYSSWAAYQNLNAPSLLNRADALSWFGEVENGCRSVFLQYHEDFKLEMKFDWESAHV